GAGPTPAGRIVTMRPRGSGGGAHTQNRAEDRSMKTWIGSIGRLRVAMLAVAVGCIVLVPAATAAAKKKNRIGVGQAQVAKPGPPRAMYWGAWIGKGLTGTDAPYDMSGVTKFQNMVGKPLSLVEWSLPFQDCTVSP